MTGFVSSLMKKSDTQTAPKPERGALLGSIQNFNKGGLKKAKTVDKSGPVTCIIFLNRIF
jgi:hypothetical protein